MDGQTHTDHDEFFALPVECVVPLCRVEHSALET